MEKLRIYEDRKEAGFYLAQILQEYQNQPNTLVLGLPRGGVPVAHEIATALHLPCNIFLVRKLGVPNQKELAMGAIAEKDVCVFNEDVIQQLGITEWQIQHTIDTEKQELNRRLRTYRQGNSLPDLKEQTIILVDDGIATGATIKAAIHALTAMHPKNIVVAVPVASQESVLELLPLVHKIVCPLTPKYFFGVGHWYKEFPQISDEEVVRLLSLR